MPRRGERKQKTRRNAAANRGTFVRVCRLGKGGRKQAEIVRNDASLGPKCLKKFKDEIQDLLENAPPGAKILCLPVDDPRPDNVTPTPDAQLLRKKPQRHGSNPRSGRNPECRLQALGTDETSLQFDPHPADKHGEPRLLNVDSLKITDRFLAAREGATFDSRNMALVRFADDVVGMGLPQEPNIDRNPYNFVPWSDEGQPSSVPWSDEGQPSSVPWSDEGQPGSAERPQDATHDRISDERLSGQIAVTFTAQTPIFVPEGQLPPKKGDPDGGGDVDGTPLRFFHCWNGTCDRYAIPGASVKGAVRSLFEALTNSRAGVTDDSALGSLGKGDRYCAPLYRRRATRLFQVISAPHGSGPIKVKECEYVWYGRNGRVRQQSKNFDPNQPTQIKNDWRANLFWVEPAKHCHGETIGFYLTKREFTLTPEVLQRFRSMKGHPHLKRHGGKSGNATSVPPANGMYKPPVPEYSEIESDLFRLHKCDFIFGIPAATGSFLRCFGKNVNFLWPGAASPLQMMGLRHTKGRGPFASRRPDEQQLKGSDPAEATFGFAGKHTDNSHPFRGRVRFGTFWGPPYETDPNPAALQLMPLTSPSGTKAKARSLYLEGAKGKSADYDLNARLRGRKFYWHQRGVDEGNVPGVHDFGKLSAGMPQSWKEDIKSQLPAPIIPLPPGSQFTGALHFTNLTEAELGALLVSIKPDLAFDSEGPAASVATESPGYGVKLGKGKPRGLGSVTASIELQLATAPRERYRCLDAEPATTQAATGYIEAYKAWCMEEYKTRWCNGKVPQGEWEDLPMAKALKALLRIPQAASVRVYPPLFAMYGWLPKEDHPDGEPTSRRGHPPGPRPDAMTPAHELKGP